MPEPENVMTLDVPVHWEVVRFITILRQHLPELSDRYKVKSLGVFGSYVRNQQKKKSDLDILVEFSEPTDLFAFVELESYLSDLLGVKVDLVMKDTLKPRIGKHILREVIFLSGGEGGSGDEGYTETSYRQVYPQRRDISMKKPKREFIDYVQDILDAMEKIERFTEGMDFDRFAGDEKTVLAVTRAFEIIGEAVKNIPKVVRNRHSSVPWKDMAGMRDKLIHEYFGVNLPVVWEVVKQKIPTVKPLIAKVLEEEIQQESGEDTRHDD